MRISCSKELIEKLLEIDTSQENKLHSIFCFICIIEPNVNFLNSKIVQGKPPLLHRYPDALAGQQELENIAKSAKAHHFALPPNKRVNFAKLGIASPFQPPWTVLVKDWRTDNSLQPSQLPEAVHVLRDEDVLKRLRVGDVNGLEVLLDHLVAVKLRIEGKGKLGENTIICIPSPQDLEGIFLLFILY